MTTPTLHRVRIPAGQQHPEIDADFGRINVLLGANGTGKSALLETMKSNIHSMFGLNQVRKVDARRIMRVVGTSSLTRNQVGDNVESVVTQILEQYNENPSHRQTAASRLLEALCHRSRKRDLRYAEECHKLATQGKNSAIIPREPSPLDEFCALYKSALPELELVFDTSAVTLKVKRGDSVSYGPESFSSGEEQVFLLLGKFIFGHPKAVFLIDEPELNLNPRLAEKFWSIVERRHPDCVFIYATHALHFALRPEVSRALVLTKSGVVGLDESQEFLALAREDREQFLGSIPSIVLASKILFTEGEPDSIDRSLYEYILQDSAIRVESLGGCEEVEKAVAGKEGWERFTRDAKVAGVIDADYKPVSEIGRLKKLNVLLLPMHEAESILCHPDAVESLSTAMHPQNKQVTAAAVAAALQTRLQARRIPIALRRAARVFRAQLAPSVSAKAMDSIASEIDAENAFDSAVSASLGFLQAKNPKQVVQDELKTIDDAIARGDTKTMLSLFPGKEFTQQIKSLLGIAGTDSDLLGYYQKHFPNADLGCFQAIRTELKKLFA